MIIFDLQAVQSVAHGERGVARYVAELASALARRHPDAVDVFAYNDRLPWVARLDTLQLGDRLQPFSALRGRTVDLVHTNSPFELLPLHHVQLPVVARRSIVTCYDLIPHIFPHVYLPDSSTKVRYQARLQMLLAADEIVTDSESAARDVARLLEVAPRRLTSLGAGVSPDFGPPTKPLADRLADLRVALPTLRAGYIFVPTGMDWRKNIDGALESLARLPLELRRRHQLVVACRMSEEQFEHLAWQCDQLGITSDEVLVTGFVSDEDLVLLYQSAEVVFFPSYYEGFGLPVLEARRCGARVICSHTSSLPEVLPEPAALFNPYNRAEMAAKLEAALTDNELKDQLDDAVDPGFSWELAADRLVAVYNRVRPAAAGTRRARVAVVTLLPPTQSGIAGHSERLLTEMHRLVDVTAVVHHDVTRHVGNWPFDVVGLRTLPSRWAIGDFDHVIYCMGNNAMHSAFLPMLDRVPGFVLAHDIRLGGCVSTAERQDIWARDADDLPDLDEKGTDVSFAIASIARRSQAVLVHSRHAADLVRERSDAEVIDVGPLPLPTDATMSAAPASTGEAIHLVVSAGIADVSKGSDVVADAMRRVVSRRDDTSAVLVGPGGDAFLADNVPTTPVLQVAGTVGSTGVVDDHEFDAWLAGTTVAVQLRVQTNGESSGVAAQTLARGVPTIVSDFGSMAELPDDAVVKVPVDITGADLAEVIASLLDDTNRRLALRDASLAFAQQATYAASARKVVEAVS